MSEESHCADCCCARSWTALDITEYTGKSIPEHIIELRLRAETAEEWKRAVEDAAVVSWVRIEGKTPREAVNALLAWESQVALDPAVSEGAVKLHAEAYAKGQRTLLVEIKRLMEEADQAHREYDETWVHFEDAIKGLSLPIKGRP